MLHLIVAIFLLFINQNYYEQVTAINIKSDVDVTSSQLEPVVIHNTSHVVLQYLPILGGRGRLSSLLKPQNNKTTENKSTKNNLFLSKLSNLFTRRNGVSEANTNQSPSSFQQLNCTKNNKLEEPPSNALKSLGLSEFQIDLFKQHNMYRQNVGLQLLQWDKSLEAFITEYIIHLDRDNQCTMEHSTTTQRSEVGVFSNIGENLYSRWGTYDSLEGTRPVDSWYNEVYCYRYGRVGDECTKYNNELCYEKMGFTTEVMVGHFTQLMWSATSHVGCAGIRCGSSYDGYGYKYIVGCSYGSVDTCSGGNVYGEYPFSYSVAELLGIPKCFGV